MVHERDDQYESQDDSEYHFTDDDQANYEMETDITSPAETVTSKKPFNFKEVATQYKRPLIGASVFIVLIFLVYKIMSPATPQEPTDFTPGTPVEKAQVVKPATPQQLAAQTTTPVKTEQPAFQPLAEPLGMSGSTPSGVATPPKTAPASPPVEVSQTPPLPPESTISPVSTQPAAPSSNLPKSGGVESLPPPIAAQSRPAMPAEGAQQPPVIIANEAPPPPLPVSANTYNPLNPADQVQYEPTEIAKLNQKLVTVTQQNAQMHTEYSQKVAEYESQNAALQDKVKDLNNRIAGLESTIVKLGKSLQDQKESNTEYPASPSYRAEPRINYTVQAIIPGRAWLKSGSGETVTVAEGDSLKGYGRIIKIDPYDGVVQIDVGGRLASLTYGVSTE